MFNSSHTLVGLALARAGLDRWCHRAGVTAVIAANLPDIDIATMLHSSPAYIEYHRGITHSIAGIPPLSLLVAAAMYKFSGNFRRTFAVALLAMSTHPFLDFLNTYGIRPYLPFDGTWYYGDLLFVIDPIFDGILLATMLVGHSLKKYRPQMAVAGLVLVTAYVGMQLEFRNLSRSYIGEFQKAGVSPVPLSPLHWTGIIDMPDEWRVVAIHPFHGIQGESDRMPKVQPSDIVRRASETRSGSAFFGFARFPVVRVQRIETGHSVTFLDLRFYRSATNTAFAARILLDHSLNVIEESLGFNQYVD